MSDARSRRPGGATAAAADDAGDAAGPAADPRGRADAEGRAATAAGRSASSSEPAPAVADDGVADGGDAAARAGAEHDHGSPIDDLGGYIRHQRESAALSLRKLAKIAGVSNPYLSQIERGLRKPSAEILQAIAKALEISSETLYVKAGILDEREVVVDVEAAVAADPHLTGPQRQALLEMYRSFRRLSELKEPRPSRRRQLLDALTAGDVDDAAIRAAEPAATPEDG